MNFYTAGSLVTVTANFVDLVTQQPADPTTVTLKASVNNAGATTYTYGVGGVITRTGTGAYTANLDTTGKPGNWWYEWAGTGSVQAIQFQGFVVQAPPL